MEIIYVTSNEKKFQTAQVALKGSGIVLRMEEMETPEIQSIDVKDVAAYSVKWACDKLGKPIILSDGGFYIESLNGFPGPFIKYINKWLSAGDILNLMYGKDNRKVEVRSCVAFCEPGKEPALFLGLWNGTIALKAGKKGITPINEVFIPQGYDKPESEIPTKDMMKFWGEEEGWKKLANYLKNQ